MFIQLTLLMDLLQKVYATYIESQESQDIVKSIEEIARIKEIARIEKLVDTSFTESKPSHFDLSKKYLTMIHY